MEEGAGSEENMTELKCTPFTNDDGYFNDEERNKHKCPCPVCGGFLAWRNQCPKCKSTNTKFLPFLYMDHAYKCLDCSEYFNPAIGVDMIPVCNKCKTPLIVLHDHEDGEELDTGRICPIPPAKVS